MVLAAAFFSATLLGVSGDASPGSTPVRWFGLAFGTAVVSYRPLLGDPLRVTHFPDARRARFAVPGAPHAYVIVTERRGAVAGIEAGTDTTPAGPLTAVEADPAGIRLGSPYGEVAAARPGAQRWVGPAGDVHLRVRPDARGVVADYRFSDGRLVADDWSSSPDRDGPQLPGANPYDEPAGDGDGTAILAVQASGREGVAWENLYVRSHPCDATASWRADGAATHAANGRIYDVVTARCPTTGATRTFTFDITSFSGKP